MAEEGMVSRRTHTTEVGEVLLGSLVLLVLIDPLVEVGLEPVNLLGVLEEAGPVGLLELLLAQLQLDVLGGVVDLALGDIDLGEELDVEVVGPLEGIRVAGEGKALGLQVQLEVGGRDIGHADGQVDEVLGLVGLGRTLRPED